MRASRIIHDPALAANPADVRGDDRSLGTRTRRGTRQRIPSVRRCPIVPEGANFRAKRWLNTEITRLHTD